MKTIFRPWQAVAILALAVSFSSCKKDDDSTEPTETTTPQTFTQSFSAKVDGVTFNENIFMGMESTAAQRISVTASANSSFPSIGLSFSNTITPGTYTMNGFSTIGMYNVGQNTNDMYSTSAGSGTLVITSHDTANDRVVGTFSFIAAPSPGNSNTNSHTITEGSFAVQY